MRPDKSPLIPLYKRGRQDANLLIIKGRVLDPANHTDGIYDVLVEDGKISKISKKIKPVRNCQTISAKGLWVMPGLIDVHVHLREPGGEESETIATGSRAAASGGVTSLLVMANTKIPIDSPEQVHYVKSKALEAGIVKVYPVGAVTKGLEGKELSPIRKMAQAGCSAFSDDGRCVMNSRLMRNALAQCKELGIPLMDHCEDENLSLGGSMNEGAVSEMLGYQGIPAESESIAVARNILLSKKTGAHIHCTHISCRESVELIRCAKKMKVPITADAAPHHFTLTEDAVKLFGTQAKMKPPLRTRKDLEAVKEGLSDGTIDLIASDHAPHDPLSKQKDFSDAPFGIIGLETLFVLTYTELVLKKVIKPLEAVRKLTELPAKIFKLKAGSLTRGTPADIAIFDPNKSWVFIKEDIFSKSSNTPFLGRKFQGRITTTIVNGKIVYQR